MKIGIYPALLNKTFTVLSKQKLGFVWKLFARLPLTQKMKLNTKNSVFMQTILQNPSSLAFIVSVGVKNRTEIPHEEQKITIGNFEKEQSIDAQRYKHRKWVGVRAAKSSMTNQFTPLTPRDGSVERKCLGVGSADFIRKMNDVKNPSGCKKIRMTSKLLLTCNKKYYLFQRQNTG